MKRILLSLCLVGAVLADEEAQDTPIEELTIDPLLSMKEQFLKARKKGWDFSPEKKTYEYQPTADESTYTFQPPDDQPLQKSQQLAKSFRRDISEVERAKIIDQINEMDRVKRPKQKNKSH